MGNLGFVAKYVIKMYNCTYTYKLPHRMPKLSIILPCYNEEQVIAMTVQRVMQWLGTGRHDAEVIAVDNASTDNTPSVLRELCQRYPILRVVTRELNGGYGSSVRSGCDAAQGEIIAWMDADGQFDVQDFDTLLPHLASVDFVSGIRAKRSDSWMRLLLGRMWDGVIRICFGIRARDIDCGMKAFRHDVWPLIRPTITVGDAFNSELFFRLQRCGLTWQQKPVRHLPRLTGKSGSVRLPDILKAVIDTVRLFFAARFGSLRCPPPHHRPDLAVVPPMHT